MNMLRENEPLTHNQKNYFYNNTTVSSENSLPYKFSSPKPLVEVERFPPSPDPTIVKKLNHNASERDRRKKIKRSIASLGSLLPVPHQTKKLSVPNTISLVVKYIPELQHEVEGLSKKKEELLSRISQQGDAVKKQSQRKISQLNSVFVVSATRLNFNEAAIQISSYEVYRTPLSEILLFLENNGFCLLSASSSETIGGRVFYNLHLQLSHFLVSTSVGAPLISLDQSPLIILSDCASSSSISDLDLDRASKAGPSTSGVDDCFDWELLEILNM
ncbi:transcription factor ORG2-like [Gastrolobium bilobum]|uniref:transcription factor ORG2-like n=1 Tax=Gastrolobium bilobum TaxID=150636 RepID=UPI002AB0B8C1|nr:transcription factor ORG2-like [Gastrolobium bilobum]